MARVPTHALHVPEIALVHAIHRVCTHAKVLVQINVTMIAKDNVQMAASEVVILTVAERAESLV